MSTLQSFISLFDLETTKQLITCLIIKLISIDDLLSKFSQSQCRVKVVSNSLKQVTFILIVIFLIVIFIMSKWSKLKTLNKMMPKEGEEEEGEDAVSDKIILHTLFIVSNVFFSFSFFMRF